MAVPPLHATVPPLHAANHPSPLWQTCDYALRRMATTDSTGQKEIHTSPVLLLRKENLFRWAPALAVSYQTPLVPDPNLHDAYSIRPAVTQPCRSACPELSHC